MNPTLKTAMACILSIIITLAIIPPVQPIAATTPPLLPAVTITFGGNTSITLTHVYQYYWPEGSRMGVYMAPHGTVTFDQMDGPTVYGLGTLYAQVPFSVADLNRLGAFDINIGRCWDTGEYLFPNYMDLVGGVYEWVAQLLINPSVDFAAFSAALDYSDAYGAGRQNLLRHSQAQIPSAPEGRVLRFVIGSTTFADGDTLRRLEAAPFIDQGRTMVPLRVIGEALGATQLDMTAGVVSFYIDGARFEMTIGQALPSQMGTPVIVEERTFVPLAFVINEIGANARWDSENRAAYVYIL